MKGPHLERILEAFNKLPESERRAYSIFSALNDTYGHNVPVEPIKIIKSYGRSRTHSLDLLSNVVLDEPISGSDIYDEMSEIPFRDLSEALEFSNGLFISDIQAANDMGLIRKNQIYSILTLGKSNKPLMYPSVQGGYNCIPLEDSSTADILRYMDCIFSFIDSHLEKGNVLVHCMRGKNRSCAAVVGYLMRKFNISYEVALGIIKQARPICKIQLNFEKQLKSSRWKNTYS